MKKYVMCYEHNHFSIYSFMKAFKEYKDKQGLPTYSDYDSIIAQLSKFSLEQEWFFYKDPNTPDYLFIFKSGMTECGPLKLDYDENCVYISAQENFDCYLY